MSAQRPRLGPEDWLSAGLSALTSTGPSALKAEALARDLGTTKGSFYWHFKDIAAFHAALAEFWRAQAETALGDAAETTATPAQRLRDFAALTGTAPSGFATEAAVRAWARFEPCAADAVAQVDGARLAHIRSILSALDLTNPDFARIVLAAHIGMLALSGDDEANGSAHSTLAAALLALQDA